MAEFTSAEQQYLERMRTLRYRCRTDLIFLAREVLGYKKIDPVVHGPVLDVLQKFPLPSVEEQAKKDRARISRGTIVWDFTPTVPIDDLLCTSRVLILDPRSWYKTTINTISHSIQWIINYPEITILVIQSTGEKAEAFVSEIKQHFQVNKLFREIFPEHCPDKKIFDWGTKSRFTTEARASSIVSRQPTVMAMAIDKGSAGLHVDVMKFSDIVEPNNVITRSQCIKVYDQYVMFNNLLTKPQYWIDVEGTRYDFSDAYGRIIEAEEEYRKKTGKRRWKLHIRGCFKKQTPDGAPETYQPNELGFPYAEDEDGQFISNFPQEWPVDALLGVRDQNPEIFACQQLNNPNDWSDMLAFPLNLMVTKSRQVYRQNARIIYHTTTVDTAETDGAKSKFSAITTVGWDASGIPWVHDIRHGRFLPDELIKQIFQVQNQFRPRYIIIEETSFVRGLMASINRSMQLGIAPQVNFKFVRRDNVNTKEERILLTLQPMYKNKQIYFVDDLVCMDALKNELARFPKYQYTDILDTLADQFQGRDYFGRLQERSSEEKDALLLKNLGSIQEKAFHDMVFNKDYHAVLPPGYHEAYDITGGL